MNDDGGETREQLFADPFTFMPRKLTNDEIGTNFKCCIFIFLMQMLMIFTTFSYTKVSSTLEIGEGLFTIYVIRLMCALALHMLIEPEIY